MVELKARSRQLHRIDPRLVHSTVLEAWVPHLDARRVVVADAEVAADPRRMTIFRMSARDVSAVDFVAPKDLAPLLASLPAEESVLVVYEGLAAFHEALDGGLAQSKVVIGHLPDGPERRRLNPSVYVGEEELGWVERLTERGVEVAVQPLPSDSPMGLRRGEDGRPVLSEDIPVTGSWDVPPALLRPPDKSSPEPVVVESEPIRPSSGSRRSGQVEVVNERGLHLRAAHLLAQLSGRYASSVEVGWDGQMVNAKSLLGITTLGASKGSHLDLEVEGPDAEEAFTAISELFGSGFDEGSE